MIGQNNDERLPIFIGKLQRLGNSFVKIERLPHDSFDIPGVSPMIDFRPLDQQEKSLLRFFGKKREGKIVPLILFIVIIAFIF